MAMMSRLPMTTREPVSVVLTIDPALEAWTDEQRARYLAAGEGPAPPSDATVIRIRPMGWAQRREVQRACAGGLWSARGGELHRQFIEAMVEAGPGHAGAAGDAFRLGLSLADRVELDRAAVLQLEHDHALAAACVVDVREGTHTEEWGRFLDTLATETVQRVLFEVVRHIHRISRLDGRQRF